MKPTSNQQSLHRSELLRLTPSSWWRSFRFTQVPDAQAANVSSVGDDGNVYRTRPTGRSPQTTDATAETRYVTRPRRTTATIVAIAGSLPNAFAYFLNPENG